MKKLTRKLPLFSNSWYLPKFIMVMKLTVFIIIATTLKLLAVESYSQATRLNVDFENSSVLQVLNSIEKQSDFYFLYSTKLVDVDRSVSVDYKDAPINDILVGLFEGTDVDFLVMDKQIVLSKKELLGKTPPVDKQQQPSTVTGIVTDETGQTLPGVAIYLRGTTEGSITDFEGNYTISNVTADAILVFSYVGKKTQEIAVGDQTNINVTMQVDLLGIEEVVAIGYASAMKKDLTGAVANLSEENFNNGVFTTADELMKGKLAGVRVTTTSGEPGEPLNVFIRGANSIRTGNMPLYVIDGIPFGDVPNPQDVESIDVLKDASAAAVYGSRGANGVILITTKKGKKGQKSTVNYTNQIGFATVANRPELLTGPEYVEAVGRIIGPVGSDIIYDPNIDTDWQDESYRMGLKQSHTLSFQGGTELSTYLVSLNYMDEEGIMKETGFKSFRGLVNASHDLFQNRLSINFHFIASQNHRDIPYNPGFVGSVGSPMIANPTYPIYKEDNFRGYFIFPLINSNNPALERDIETTFNDRLNLAGNVQSELKILPSLSYVSNVGVGKTYSAYLRSINANPSDIWTQGYYDNSHGEYNNLLVDNLLKYTMLGRGHRLNVLLGHSYQKFLSKSSGFYSSIVDPATSIDPIYNAGVVTNITSSGSYQENELQSFFSRIHYSLVDKYLLTVTARADGSSKFGKNNKYGFFPSAAFAWRISEEGFLKDIGQIEELKLRIGWGRTGNQEIPNKITKVAYTENWVYGAYMSNESGITEGITLTRTSNPDLQWETTSQLNVGVDFSLFNNCFSGSIEHYSKSTTDLLIYTTAIQPSPVANVWTNLPADITNKGIDLQLNGDVIRGTYDGFRWSLSANASYNKNNIENLLSPIRTGVLSGLGLSGVTVNKYIDDYPLGGFWLKLHEGFDENGYSVFTDVNNDGVVTTDDEVYCGTALPTWVFGLTSNFGYKRWGLNVVFDGVQGNKIYNNTANTTALMGSIGRGYNVLKTVVETGEALNNSAPASTRFLEDGSFLRLSNININYNFKTDNISWIRNFKLFITGSNLFVLTKYSIFDPEVSINTAEDGNNAFGIDLFSYPKSKSIIIGFDISF